MLVRLCLAVAANLSGPVRPCAWSERLHLLPLPSLLCLLALFFLFCPFPIVASGCARIIALFLLLRRHDRCLPFC